MKVKPERITDGGIIIDSLIETARNKVLVREEDRDEEENQENLPTPHAS